MAGRQLLVWFPPSRFSSSPSGTPVIEGLCFAASLSLDTFCKLTGRIPNVARTDVHIVTVAQIMMTEMASLYASLKPSSVSGEEVSAFRLRAPAWITACGGMLLVCFGTVLMSSLISRFPPTEMPIALPISVSLMDYLGGWTCVTPAYPPASVTNVAMATDVLVSMMCFKHPPNSAYSFQYTHRFH